MILFDARNYYSNGGIGEYTRNILHELIKIYPNRLIVLCKSNIPLESCHKLIIPFPFVLSNWVVNSILFASYLKRRGFWPLTYFSPIISSVHNSISSQVVVVHDVPPTHALNYHMPSNIFSKNIPLLYNASKIICISESTKKQLLSIDPVLEFKSFVVKNGISCPGISYQPVDYKILPKSKYICTIGFNPRKNILNLIHGFNLSSFKNDGGILVIVGDCLWDASYYQSCIDAAKSSSVVFYGNLSDAKKNILLSHAQSYISASFFEGHGLTIAEASFFSIPLVASDIDAHREFYNDCAIFFDPNDINDIADKIDLSVNVNHTKTCSSIISWKTSCELLVSHLC